MVSAMTIFQGLRANLAPPELADLRTAVREHYEHLLHAQEQNELIAIDLAELLCDRLDQLLAMAHQLALEARLDIVGAARYFVEDQDLIPDEKSCTGLDDDVLVFNHVARSLGRPDLVIEDRA